jgi:hypothetical protein
MPSHTLSSPLLAIAVIRYYRTANFSEEPHGAWVGMMYLILRILIIPMLCGVEPRDFYYPAVTEGERADVKRLAARAIKNPGVDAISREDALALWRLRRKHKTDGTWRVDARDIRPDLTLRWWDVSAGTCTIEDVTRPSRVLGWLLMDREAVVGLVYYLDNHDQAGSLASLRVGDNVAMIVVGGRDSASYVAHLFDPSMPPPDKAIDAADRSGAHANATAKRAADFAKLSARTVRDDSRDPRGQWCKIVVKNPTARDWRGLRVEAMAGDVVVGAVKLDRLKPHSERTATILLNKPATVT